MLTHTVILRLKRPVEAGSRTAFIEALTRFGATPPHAEGPALVAVDADLRPEGPSVAEASMVVEFADAAAFRAYLADGAHVDLVENVLRPSCESWLSLQSES